MEIDKIRWVTVFDSPSKFRLDFRQLCDLTRTYPERMQQGVVSRQTAIQTVISLLQQEAQLLLGDRATRKHAKDS